jgi:hypothetical protein
MFAEEPTDDEPQVTFNEIIKMATGRSIKPHRDRVRDDLSPTEMAEMAHAMADQAPHKSDFKMSPIGHALVSVGYPREAKIAQHDTHLGLQHDYNMVLVKTDTIENPEGYHDYELAHYLHRDHYDEAVLRDAIHHYR